MLADEHGCESVAFPLLSSDSPGYPREQALDIAIDTIGHFVLQSDMTVYLVVFDRAAYQLKGEVCADIRAYINDRYVDVYAISQAIAQQEERLYSARMPDCSPSPSTYTLASLSLEDAVKQLEEITGKKWSDEKFKEVTGFSCRSSRAWLAATGCAKYVPSPFNGFDLLNHMAVMVTARGKSTAADAMETLLKEYEDNHKNGTSTFRTEEKYRILFEGIACWPYLRATSTGLKSRGINMVTTIYADAFGYDYDSFEGMIKAYCSVPNAINLEKSRDKRIKLCKDNHVEGMLVHTNRSCKLWSGFMYEMGRQVGKACDIPVASFDGDQADPRNFSEAQYDTRVQGLMEIMEANKEQKGAN